MKHLPLKLIFLPLIFLTIIGGLNAQANCSLPATPDLYVISTSINSTEIAWAEVPGAAGYQIETVEVNSGTTVSSLFTINNTIVITGLQAGTEYDIYVTTQCDNGLPGGVASLRLTTGIVVVDVIIQLNCVPGTGTYTSYGNNYAPGNSTSYSLNPNEVISFDGTVGTNTVSDPNSGPFKLMFTTNTGNGQTPPELIISTTSDFNDVIRFTQNTNYGGLPFIEYKAGHLPDQPQNWETMAVITPTFSGNANIEIQWTKQVNSDFTYCDNTRGGKEKVDGEQNDAELEVSPNPTNGWFSILVHEDSPVLISDMNGQIWHESELFAGEPQELDATDWPNGTYIIRTIEHDEVINTLLFKTD